MTKRTKNVLLWFAALTLPGLAVQAQSVPAGVGVAPNVGFQLPELNGSFNYSLNASELISSSFYGNQGTQYSTNLSATASYQTGGARHPFSGIYSGGVLLANSGQPTTTYQSLALSQSYNTKNWNFTAGDQVSYLPESPVNGLSGIPGVGDLGIAPVPIGSDAGIGILTNYGPRISNIVNGSASRFVGRRFSVQASGYDNIQRFIGDNATEAIDNSGYGGTGGVSYHFDARSALTLNYSYSDFSYGGTSYAFSTQSGTVDYSRQWSRRFSTDVYAGPQHIANGNPALGGSSIQVAAGGSASFESRVAYYTVAYTRGTNNGSGVIAGSFSDSVVAAARRQFGRKWNTSASLGYTRSRGLPTLESASFSSDSVSASGQVVRALGRRFSSYASYTVEHQSTSGEVPLLNTFNILNGTNAFSGFYQIFGIGVSYSPGSLFLHR